MHDVRGCVVLVWTCDCHAFDLLLISPVLNTIYRYTMCSSLCSGDSFNHTVVPYNFAFLSHRLRKRVNRQFPLSRRLYWYRTRHRKTAATLMKGSPQYHDPQGERGNHQYLTPQERKRLRPALALGMRNDVDGHLLAEHTYIRLAVCVIAI